jgi:hypothetical protein
MATQTRESDSDIKTDPTDSGTHERPATFRERHGLKVMGAIMAVLFAVVMAVQVAC